VFSNFALAVLKVFDQGRQVPTFGNERQELTLFLIRHDGRQPTTPTLEPPGPGLSNSLLEFLPSAADMGYMVRTNQWNVTASPSWPTLASTVELLIAKPL
jgi:hypothetical protein